MRLFLLAVLLMVGCVHPVTDPAQIESAGTRPYDSQVVLIVERAVAGLNLKDPESARITNTQVDGVKKWVEPSGAFIGWQISFYLNAKNSYGGYVGSQKYLCLLRADGRFLTRQADAWHP